MLSHIPRSLPVFSSSNLILSPFDFHTSSSNIFLTYTWYDGFCGRFRTKVSTDVDEGMTKSIQFASHTFSLILHIYVFRKIFHNVWVKKKNIRKRNLYAEYLESMWWWGWKEICASTLFCVCMSWILPFTIFTQFPHYLNVHFFFFLLLKASFFTLLICHTRFRIASKIWKALCELIQQHEEKAKHSKRQRVLFIFVGRKSVKFIESRIMCYRLQIVM